MKLQISDCKLQIPIVEFRAAISNESEI